MTRFIVQVRREEIVEYGVDADNAEAAADSFWEGVYYGTVDVLDEEVIDTQIEED